MIRYLRSWRAPRLLVMCRPAPERAEHAFKTVFGWVAEFYPECLPLFAVEELPYAMPRFANFALYINWLPDPVKDWSKKSYRQAQAHMRLCDRRGIPIVNRVENLANAIKSVGARLMAAEGIRTPRMAVIRDAEEFRATLLGIPLPLFVRENWGHGGRMLRADTRAAARRIPLERFKRPVAVELIDAPAADGLYRKYRYFAAGDHGVSHHVQVSDTWIARGRERVKTDVTRADELAYIARLDPNHEALQRARKALRLDYVAFDYGYDREGRMVVWEANPYPFIKFSKADLVYRNHAIHRTVAAMLLLYLEKAGLKVPDRLAEEVAYR